MTQSKSGAASRTGARAELPAYVAVNCPLCGADDYHVRFEDRLGGVSVDPQRHYTSTSSAYGEHGRIVECRSCDLVYMNPRPHHQSVQDNYSAVEDTRYLDEEQGRVETFTESLEHVAEFMPSGRMLDVGCHVGTFLTIAEQHGFEVAGVEPSPGRRRSPAAASTARCTAARSRMRRCRRAATTSITLWDVIEHLPDPALDLRSIHSSLRPGGIFAVSTMDVDSLFAARARPALAVVHADAPRVLLARDAVRDAAPRGLPDRRRPAAHAPRPALVPGLAARRLRSAGGPACSSPALQRVGLGERTVPIKLGDIFTVIARKPPRRKPQRHDDRARASIAGSQLAGQLGRAGGALRRWRSGACRSSSGAGRGC